MYISVHVLSQMCIIVHIKCPSIVSFFNETRFFSTHSPPPQKKNILIPRFMKLRPVGAELFRTDERKKNKKTDMTKLIVVFRNFANALNKHLSALNVESFLTFFFFTELVNLKVATRRLLHSALAGTKCWSLMFYRVRQK